MSKENIFERVAKKVEEIRKEHPPKYLGSEVVTTSFDGSFCHPWVWHKWDHPADEFIYDYLQAINEGTKDILYVESQKAWKSGHVCTKECAYWHD